MRYIQSLIMLFALSIATVAAGLMYLTFEHRLMPSGIWETLYIHGLFGVVIADLLIFEPICNTFSGIRCAGLLFDGSVFEQYEYAIFFFSTLINYLLIAYSIVKYLETKSHKYIGLLIIAIIAPVVIGVILFFVYVYLYSDSDPFERWPSLRRRSLE